MTNADKFKAVFGIYSEEFWAKPESDMLNWINSEYQEPKSKVDVHPMQWIPVTESLPEGKDGNYLVAMKTSRGIEVHEAYFFEAWDSYEWYDPVEEYQKYDVTHWMPLPEPPKDGET